MRRIAAALAILCYLGITPAAAQNDAPPVDWKKTEKGAGGLFSGMGQEIKKLFGDKKDGKPEPKKEEKK
jgi:hypothetical protein